MQPLRLLSSQLSASSASLTCHLSLSPSLSLLRFSLVNGGQLAAATFTAMLAASELLCSSFGPPAVHRFRHIIVALGWLLSALFTSLPVVMAGGAALPQMTHHDV